MGIEEDESSEVYGEVKGNFELYDRATEGGVVER